MTPIESLDTDGLTKVLVVALCKLVRKRSTSNCNYLYGLSYIFEVRVGGGHDMMISMKTHQS